VSILHDVKDNEIYRKSSIPIPFISNLVRLNIIEVLDFRSGGGGTTGGTGGGGQR
jgi:hypothetical protein